MIDAPSCRKCGSIMVRGGLMQCGNCLMQCGNCGHLELAQGTGSKPTHAGLCLDPACTSIHCQEAQRTPKYAPLPSGLVPRPSPGAKHDTGKPRYSLLPWRALDEVVAVLEHGVGKYGEGNWRLVPDATRRYIDAGMRHLVAYMRGEEQDPESKRSHLAHAVCSLLFVLELEEKP